ncbi:sterol desaturase family protein [bacterium]|nr:sterol desaturase family protein [bacterium]
MAKKFVSNKDETIRMFKSDFLEFLSRVHPVTPLVIFVPVIVYMMYLSVTFRFTVLQITSWSIFGLVFWTFAEYTLHRFVFHFTPRGAFMERIHFMFHGVHHDYPMDSRRLVMPPIISIPLSALFYWLFDVAVDNRAIPMWAGFMTGYLFYDMTHYAIHHFPMKSPFWLAIKNHHIKHHFQDSSKGYGVSSPIWDYIWKTAFPAKDEQKTETSS